MCGVEMLGSHNRARYELPEGMFFLPDANSHNCARYELPEGVFSRSRHIVHYAENRRLAFEAHYTSSTASWPESADILHPPGHYIVVHIVIIRSHDG